MTEEQVSNIRPAQLIQLYLIGFKLVPLDQKGKPAIDRWTSIYEDPDYWTPERLVQESYTFKNVATVFGKTWLKDQQGRDLYLNELDIDSQQVYETLFNLKNGHAEETETYSLIPLMQKRSVVIKTRKPYGFRMSWLSHEQNKPIHTADCRHGYEYEIKTDKSSGHSTLPPSRHRDDPNFHYKNIGQEKLYVSDEMYGKLVEVLAECLKPTTNEDHSRHKVRGGISVELDNKAIQTICESISPYYQKGSRDLLVFGLSGLSHKLNVSLESAINLIQILADNDEERISRITVLQDTYKKDAKDVAGYSSLLETLEHIIGDKNTAKKLLAKIVNVITQAVTSNEDQDLVLWLSNTIMEEFTFRTMTDTKEIYCFDGAKYVRGEEWRIEELCQIILPSIRTGSVQEVINHIKRATWIKRIEFDCDPNIRSVGNGLLNIHSMELTPHTADHLSVVQIPVKYDPGAKCPEIEKFLKQVLRAKDVPTILQLFGYCLIPSSKYQVAVMLFGKAANGKGTLLDLITSFLGGDNCSHRSLQQIDRDRFAIADLDGKMANTFADLKSMKLSETGNFKMAVAGDWIEGEFKFKDAFKFRNKAKLWFSANEIPESDDKSDAFYRRWRIFHFENQYLEGDEDPNLLDKLTTPEELSGLLNLALNGLDELENEGGFHGVSIADIRKDYEIHTNDVNAFLYEECIVDITNPEFYTLASEVYAAYVNFCVKRGVRSLDIKPFGKKLADRGIYNVRHQEHYEREQCYDGIKLKRKLTGEGQTIL